jgi:hypothetical protein
MDGRRQFVDMGQHGHSVTGWRTPLDGHMGHACGVGLHSLFCLVTVSPPSTTNPQDGSHRGRRVITSYLVKYADLGPEYTAWVPEKQLLRDCPTVLQAYQTACARRAG